ncbi:MAG: methyltransferase domain-containing protein [Deltaproteobacteria bacterium]|nr:methyltransferase domain-containing protein [Deltaproteobacteria bacterium]
MTSESNGQPHEIIHHPVARYYRLHSRVYDATRWSFLFGRNHLIKMISDRARPPRILDIGCGTGDNLLRLCLKFPTAEITGLDLSEAMLSIARKKLENHGCPVNLVHRAYDQPLAPATPFDLLVFSYSLSMFNPGWEQAIDCACQDLDRGGCIAVVDFHNSPFPLFKRWMALNHVRLGGHLMPLLVSRFRPEVCQLYPAYGGIWSYFLFLGKKTNP